MGKFAALLEVMGVFTLGHMAAGHFTPLVGLKPLGPLIQSGLASPNPDYIGLSGAAFASFSFQYACLLLPAFAIGWWRRRLRPRNYGITRAGQPLLQLVTLGLLCFSLVALPCELLATGRPIYQLLLAKNWTPSFWLFFAVVSIVVVPVFEEVFYRGYCQTRLEENFGGIGSIVIVSLFMTLGHSQYQHLDLVSIATIVSLIPLGLGMGFLFWKTRSLIPGMLLHAAVNTPAKPMFVYLLPLAMVVALIVCRRQVLALLQEFCRLLTSQGWKQATFVASLVAITLTIGFEQDADVFGWVAALGLTVALLIEFSARRNEHPS